MKKVIVMYPYFAFAINPMKQGAIVDFCMLRSEDDVERLQPFMQKHPRCDFYVSHGSCLTDAMIEYLGANTAVM